MQNIYDEVAYKKLIDPTTLFKDENEVKEFLKLDSTIEDLISFLDDCEEKEQYKYCQLIADKIKEKQNV